MHRYVKVVPIPPSYLTIHMLLVNICLVYNIYNTHYTFYCDVKGILIPERIWQEQAH